MLGMDTFTAWIKAVTDGGSTRDIAAALGDISHPTVARRIKDRDITLAIRIATEYQAPILDGIVATGTVTEADVAEYAKRRGIGVEDYSDIELAELILYRLQEAEAAGRESELATVTEFPAPVSGVDDSMPIDAAAYSGPDEDAERDDAFDSD